jgi:hypothetical protein
VYVVSDYLELARDMRALFLATGAFTLRPKPSCEVCGIGWRVTVSLSLSLSVSVSLSHMRDVHICRLWQLKRLRKRPCRLPTLSLAVMRHSQRYKGWEGGRGARREEEGEREKNV